MSWRPESWDSVRVERYLYSLGRASSVWGVDLGKWIWALEIRAVRTEEVRRGMGSSGLVLWLRRGRKGL